MPIYEPGDVISEAMPFAHILGTAHKKQRCDFCFREDDTLIHCADCRCMFYCSQGCKNNDWLNVHCEECALYRDHRRDDNFINQSDLTRFFLRIYLMLKKNPSKREEKYKIYDGKERTFNDLMDHRENIEKTPKLQRALRKIRDRFTEAGIELDNELFISVFGRILINSFSICDISLNELGSGLYIEASVFDHNCRPNCSAIFNGTKIQVRAMRRFDSEIEQPKITYVDLKLHTSKRQSKLLSHYFFHCKCERCQGSDDTGEYTGNQSIKDMDSDFDDKIYRENWVKAYISGLKTLPLYEQVYKGFHPDFTVQLFRIVKIRLNMDNLSSPNDESVGFIISRLHEAIKVTHGIDHPLYKDGFLNIVGERFNS